MLVESGMESRAGVADEMSLAAWRREREVLVAERDAARAKAEASEGGGSGATTFVIAVTAATLCSVLFLLSGTWVALSYGGGQELVRRAFTPPPA